MCVKHVQSDCQQWKHLHIHCYITGLFGRRILFGSLLQFTSWQGAKGALTLAGEGDDADADSDAVPIRAATPDAATHSRDQMRASAKLCACVFECVSLCVCVCVFMPRLSNAILCNSRRCLPVWRGFACKSVICCMPQSNSPCAYQSMQQVMLNMLLQLQLLLLLLLLLLAVVKQFN